MITEEDIKQLRKEITKEHEKHPKKMFYAFCVVFSQTVAKEYEEFMEGLEGDLSRKDKIAIMQGIIERKGKFWENSDLEEIHSMGMRILKEYKQRLVRKRK